MKKRIVIISAVFPPEQVTSAYLNYDLAYKLAKEYEVTVLRPYPTRPIGAKFESADVKDQTFKTILIDSYTHPQSEMLGRFRESNDFGRMSADYIKEHRNEIDFVYNDGWQLFGLFIIAKACVKYNIPYMVPIQDIYPECLLTNKNYPGFVKNVIKSVLLPIDRYYQKHAACVRTISNEMRDYLSSTRNISKENYLVVNNWQNDEDFLKDYPARPNDGKLVFAYVGSINGHANVDLIIKAFIAAKIENAELRIYGGGNKKDYCMNLVKELEAKNIFFDLVTREKVAFVQSQADVLVLALPTGNGNLCLPSKLTSYILSGKPVLASVDQDSSTNRILEDNKCGVTVLADSIELLAKAFIEYGKMKVEKLENMGKNGRTYAMKNLTRTVCLKLVVDRIKALL